MLFVRDKGQMCNNILQFAHVYSWAVEHQRSVISLRFAHKYRYFHICDLKGHRPWVYYLVKAAAALRLIPVVSFNIPGEPQEEKKRLIASKRTLVVEGWYVRYYDHLLRHIDDLRRLFAFKEEITKAVDERLFSEPKKGLRLGVHIRRGDYKTFMGGKYYFDDATYVAYIRRFASMHEGKPLTVYICTNDPAINRDYYFKELSGITVVFPNGNPAEDLYTLSQCDSVMGAPSTYSIVATLYRDIDIHWILSSEVPEQLRYSKFSSIVRKV